MRIDKKPQEPKPLRRGRRARRAGKKALRKRKMQRKKAVRRANQQRTFWMMARAWGAAHNQEWVLPFFGKQNPDPYSNHSRVRTTYRGVTYPTSEHAYLVAQARHYGMTELADLWARGCGRHFAYGRWFDASNPKDVKAWSTKAFRPIRNRPHDPLRKSWTAKRCQLMFGVCLAKFSGDKNARQTLLSTGHRYLVENSPYDADWGIGQSMSTPELTRALEQGRPGLGKNMLGSVLMSVRNTLRRQNDSRHKLKKRTLRYLARTEATKQKKVGHFKRYTLEQTTALMHHFPRQLMSKTGRMVDRTNKPTPVVAGAYPIGPFRRQRVAY